MKTLQSLEVLNAIAQRRAIRLFTLQAISRESLEALISAAIAAPSAMNRQPWAFAVFGGADNLAEYSDLAKTYLVAQHPELAEHEPRLLSKTTNIFHGAPALIVICATAPESQASEDCSLAAENLMLAAFAEGLGTCPIGFARPWLALPATKAMLGIPSDMIPVFPLVVGVPDQAPATHGRNPARILWL